MKINIKYKNMEGFIERLLEEELELRIRLNKLNDFLADDKRFMLSDYDLSLLKFQQNNMQGYLIILQKRIQLLGLELLT